MRILTNTVLAFMMVGAGAIHASEEAKAEPVSIEQLPAAVKSTFDTEEKGGQIKDISKITDGSKVKYRIHFSLEGKTHQITIFEDGQLAKKRETEKKVEADR